MTCSEACVRHDLSLSLSMYHKMRNINWKGCLESKCFIPYIKSRAKAGSQSMCTMYKKLSLE